MENRKQYILKTGAFSDDVYTIESKSLQLLAICDGFRTPAVKIVDHDFLLLEYIAPSKEVGRFKEGLKSLHSLKLPHCGLGFTTYLGHFKQYNDQGAAWAKFFYEQRIEPLYKKCLERDLVNDRLKGVVSDLSSGIYDILPPLKEFSLVHGDLWTGNYFYDQVGRLVLIDPAIYFGDPLCDIAMLDLFGGSESSEFAPAIKENLRSVSIYKGYYLMYHLFDCGKSYLEATCEALES
jgi:fructosamine-3-kinase